MRKQILIVEDDPLVAIMLEYFLDALECEIAGYAKNVADSIARVALPEIDAAILDVHLANGQTSEPVATALAAAGIPFIVTTGGFNAPVAAEYKGAPILRKPFTLSGFAQALTAIV